MKRTLLCGLAAALALAIPTKAARDIPVQVDGQEMEARCYVEQGVTYVPLRTLLETFGGWSVWWDSSTGTARAASDGESLTADPKTGSITINGKKSSARVTVENGRTYVPVRLVTESLGGSAEWDAYLGGAGVTSPDAQHDAIDVYWLSHIISAESAGEPMEGQVAVGNVVLNRVASDEFPDNIPDVIFDRNWAIQFEPVANGTVYRDPSPKSVEAAYRALNGEDQVGAALYFYAPALSEGVWINANRTYSQTIGCHRFYL